MSKLQESLVENPNWESVFDFGYYSVYIRANDLTTQPNFHIIDMKTLGKKFHCQVCINQPKYVKGETSKLSNLDITLMNNMFSYGLCLVDKPFTKAISNWKLLIHKWNKFNKQKVRLDKECPDYLCKLERKD